MRGNIYLFVSFLLLFSLEKSLRIIKNSEWKTLNRILEEMERQGEKETGRYTKRCILYIIYCISIGKGF